MDSLTAKKRSWNMSRIPSAATRPELVARGLLKQAGFGRAKYNDRVLPGSPDISFGAIRTAIFVHGCFWHRHNGCKFAYQPKTNVSFWEAKFAENQRRDRRKVLVLKKAGWRVGTLWECQLITAESRQLIFQKLGRLLEKRIEFLRGN